MASGRQRAAVHGRPGRAAAEAAAEELSRHFAARRQQRAEAYLATRAAFEPAWRDSSFVLDSLVHLTPDELEAVRDEVAAIVDRYRPRNADRSSRPDGSRPVAVVVTGHPIAPSAPTATGRGTGGG